MYITHQVGSVAPSNWVDLQVSKWFGSNLPVVWSPIRAMGSPSTLLRGGFATPHDSIWSSQSSISCTGARGSFLSKDKFAKIKIPDYLQIQAKLILPGKSPAESGQGDCWSNWWSLVLLEMSVAAPSCTCRPTGHLQPQAVAHWDNLSVLKIHASLLKLEPLLPCHSNKAGWYLDMVQGSVVSWSSCSAECEALK